jgi:hypothetical protein
MSVPGYDFCRVHCFGRASGVPWYQNALMGIVIALVLAAIGVFATWYYGTTGPPAKTDVAEAATTGYLVPAHDPTPPLPNGATAPTNLVTLFLGNSASVGVWFPHTVLAYKGKPVLTISTNSEGATVSAEFFGDNGDIVAVLKDGQFVINRLNYFVKERPDKSSLIVRDQKNITVLNVRILNPHAIQLSGRFRFPFRSDFVIDKNEGFFAQHILSTANVVDYAF